MGGAQALGGGQLAVVDVDGDDLGRTGQVGPEDRGISDAAAADDGHRVPSADVAGVDRRADAGHHPAAEETGRGR